MAYFIEIHHAIGKSPAPALSDFTWEQYPLGTREDQGFLDVDGPAVNDVVKVLLSRPDVIGVRVVFHPDPVAVLPRTFHDTIPQEGGPAVPAPADGQIMATHGR